MLVKSRFTTSLIIALLAGNLIATIAQRAPYGAASPLSAPLGTAFTYQGQLRDGNGPVSGACDFQFSLWDAASGGAQVGTTQTSTNVTVTDGVFSVALDFGASAFDGSARWLEIAVSCPAGGSYTSLSPRQEVAPAPHALFAQTASQATSASSATSATTASSAPWSGLTGVPSGFGDGFDDVGTVSYRPPQPNTTTTIDSTGFVGLYTSIAIGADGLPIISYYDDTNFDLKVAHCTNATCTTATTTTTDSTGDVGLYTSIAIGADGSPIISYYDATNSDLKVAHCTNATCTTATTTTTDSTGNVGQYTSIAIGADGLPIVSYYDVANGDLRIAHCTNTACTTATTTTTDSTGNVGPYTSIAIGADGLPIMSYHNDTNDDLKVMHCGSPYCVPYFRR